MCGEDERNLLDRLVAAILKGFGEFLNVAASSSLKNLDMRFQETIMHSLTELASHCGEYGSAFDSIGAVGGLESDI